MKKFLASLMVSALVFQGLAGPAQAQTGGPIPVGVDGPMFPPVFLPYYPSGYSSSGPIIFPGYSISDSARIRPSIYPAIPLPSREVIRAALEGIQSDKATLDMRLPTANTRVWLNDVPMDGRTGAQRKYVTPKLKPGTTYYFRVVIEYRDERGETQRDSKIVSIRANDAVIVDMRLPRAAFSQN